MALTNSHISRHRLLTRKARPPNVYHILDVRPVRLAFGP